MIFNSLYISDYRKIRHNYFLLEYWGYEISNFKKIIKYYFCKKIIK